MLNYQRVTNFCCFLLGPTWQICVDLLKLCLDKGSKVALGWETVVKRLGWGYLYKWMAHQELYGLELGEKYERYSLMNFYNWYDLLVPQICLKLSSKGSRV